MEILQTYKNQTRRLMIIKRRTPKWFRIYIKRHWIPEKKGKLSVIQIWLHWFELRFYFN